jgi:hypothetical protein
MTATSPVCGAGYDAKLRSSTVTLTSTNCFGGIADIRGMSTSSPKVDNGSGNLRLVQHLQLSGKRPRVRDYRDITKT